MPKNVLSASFDRRRFFQSCLAAGMTSPLFAGALLMRAQATDATYPRDKYPKITPQMLDDAAAVAGITLTPEQRDMVLESVQQQRDGIKRIRALKMPNSVAPAMVFDPCPAHFTMPPMPETIPLIEIAPPDMRGLVGNDKKIAFASIAQLGELLRQKKTTSAELTKLYLKRLKQYDKQLHFVITLTEERALKQAAAMDEELAAGKSRGPLHGIPWGAKDLLNVAGYPTTWGAAGMEHQQFEDDATVVKRLDDAGAVLVAKLTLGALAQGDVWFDGKTRNPWNPKQGSSGSSAGPASAIAAGCVAFAIGSETLGSISSPSTRCGDTGFRPTFGLVPRTGAMALSWSMDKLGPICRSVDDAYTVLHAIAGADGEDATVRADAKLGYYSILPAKYRIGYVPASFEVEEPKEKTAETMADFQRSLYDNQYNKKTLDVLRAMGYKLVPVDLPHGPWGAITPVLEAEAAAAFDELTRSGRDTLLTAQSKHDWPNTFRMARFYSAVDYIQAQRARSLFIEKVCAVMQTVDALVAPSNGLQLTMSNLTGHPAVIVPNGVRGKDAPLPPHTEDGASENIGGPGTPVSITFLGNLYDDARLASIARQYQLKTGFHLQHPPLFS